MTVPTIQQMAQDARGIDDDDLGSERQIAAQNAFFDEVQKRLTADEFEELEGYCLKATVDEMIDEALRVLGTQNQTDARAIADAFRQIYDATMKINEVLGRNDTLNETVPTNWPLQLSADEFAAACADMVEHYEDLAKR